MGLHTGVQRSYLDLFWVSEFNGSLDFPNKIMRLLVWQMSNQHLQVLPSLHTNVCRFILSAYSTTVAPRLHVAWYPLCQAKLQVGFRSKNWNTLAGTSSAHRSSLTCSCRFSRTIRTWLSSFSQRLVSLYYSCCTYFFVHNTRFWEKRVPTDLLVEYIYCISTEHVIRCA